MGDFVNIAYFLLPKASSAYLYDDFTFRQGLETMRRHGHSSLPVITRTGEYAGAVREGDFLWRLLGEDRIPRIVPPRELERLRVRDILRTDSHPPVRITVTMEELALSAVNQTFIPVVDDGNRFIGIIPRKDIFRYFAMRRDGEPPLQKIV